MAPGAEAFEFEVSEVSARADRGKDRPLSFAIVEFLTESPRHDQDVAEQNGRVQAEPADRLQRDLGGPRRGQA